MGGIKQHSRKPNKKKSRILGENVLFILLLGNKSTSGASADTISNHSYSNSSQSINSDVGSSLSNTQNPPREVIKSFRTETPLVNIESLFVLKIEIVEK